MKALLQELYRGRPRTLWALALLLVLNLAVAAVLVLGQRPALARKQAAVAAEQAAAGSGQADGSIAWYQRGTRELTRVTALLPSRRSFPELLGELITAAADSKVTLGAMTYKPRFIKERRLLAYDITVSGSGSYGAVKSFLYDMQTHEGLLVIDGLRLANDDPYREQVTMDLRLTVYLRDGL
jgi:Tfp pilus assembly protein PilO